MSLCWLFLLPLAASVGVSLARQRQTLAVGLSLAASLACIWLTLGTRVGQEIIFLGQQWTLSRADQVFLVLTYGATAVLLMIAPCAGQVMSFCAPALASTGLLSAALLLRALPLSLILLAAGQLVIVLGVRHAHGAEIRGASRFTAWVALPAVCVPSVLALLERFLSPDRAARSHWSAWLMVPLLTLWLGLFPADGATRLWSTEGLSLGPVFLWTAKDMAVVHLLLALWNQYPPLLNSVVSQSLSVVALLTAVYGGVLAVAQSRPSAVLACAATSALGFALQGLTSGSAHAVLGGMYLLLSRSVAVLLAASALAAMPHAVQRENESNTGSFHWRRTLLLVAFAVAILAMIGVPLLGSFGARRQIYAALYVTEPFLLLAWLSGIAGIALGLIRAGPSLWYTKEQASATRLHDLPLLLVLCLLVLLLAMELRPRTATALILEYCEPLLQLLSMRQTSGCLTMARVL